MFSDFVRKYDTKSLAKRYVIFRYTMMAVDAEEEDSVLASHN
jgi:hypothetical protein